MDEILIEEKRYVSSKRAAKITGYAKDYIGQLCREGRVPARLVGRNWYVLESAIQDHRFGGDKTVEPVPKVQQTWESPKYEAIHSENLPTIHRDQSITTGQKEEGISQLLQDSWDEWFNRVKDSSKQEQEEETEGITEETIREEDKKDEVDTIVEKENEEVPVHITYRHPPEELLPRRNSEAFITSRLMEDDVIQQKIRTGALFIKAIKVFGAFFAVLTAILAFIGSGYFDKYIISSKPVSIIAGVVLYNK